MDDYPHLKQYKQTEIQTTASSTENKGKELEEGSTERRSDRGREGRVGSKAKKWMDQQAKDEMK